MEINSTMIAIMREIINNNGRLNAEELQNRLGISKRMLDYNVKKLNNDFEEFGYLRISEIDGYLECGSDIMADFENIFLESGEVCDGYVLSPGERKNLICLSIGLKNSKTTLTSLMRLTDVSRNTAINDIMGLKEILSHTQTGINNLQKEGYFFIGKEHLIRGVIYDSMVQMIGTEGNPCLKKIVNKIFTDEFGLERSLESFIDYLEDEIRNLNSIRESDYKKNAYRELSVYLLIIILRNCKGYICDEEHELKNIPEYTSFRTLIRNLQKNGIAVNPAENEYLTSIALGLNKKIDPESISFGDIDFKEMTLDIIETFEDYACVKFENKNLLVKQMVVHVKPMYYRLVYHIRLHSVYYSELIKQTEDYYRTTSLVCQFIGEKYGFEFPEDEIRYLCTYFTSWMSGKYKKSVDQVLSIIERYAVIKDYEGLKRALQGNMEEIDCLNMSARQVTLSECLFGTQVISEKSEAETAVYMAAMPLIDRNIVPESYVDDILKEITERGLCAEICPGILLAHSRSNSQIKKVGITVAVYRQGVWFSEKSDHNIYTIIVLATPNNTAHQYALNELFNILRKKSIKECLQNGNISSVSELESLFEPENNCPVKV